jgi:hypothetical protein
MHALTFSIVRPGAKGILVGGLLTLGLFIILVTAMPGPDTAGDVLVLAAVSALIAVGLSVLISLAFLYRTTLRRWLMRHGAALQSGTSIAMAFALGYLIASARQPSSNRDVAIALLALSLAVLMKIVFAIAFRNGNIPPSGPGGKQPPPPGPRVPRPPGGRPPALSAAAVATIDEH